MAPVSLFTSEYLQTDHGKLHYVRGPENGPPLFLFHGVTRDWRDWAILLPGLLPRWQIFGLDFRGHGQSPPTSAGYRVADYIRDAAALVRHRGGDFAVVFGHSLGAMVALGVAGDSSLPVRAAILEDPPLETMGSRIKGTPFLQFFADMHQLVLRKLPFLELARDLAELQLAAPDATISTRLGDVRDAASLRFYAQCLLHLDPAVLSAVVAGDWLAGYDWKELAAKVSCPVLILQGDARAGAMLMDDGANELERTLADGTRIRFPGVGHLIHGTQPEESLKVVVNFLESLERD
jgi:pimeloyl-ACP methyl ester carboxylesterase